MQFVRNAPLSIILTIAFLCLAITALLTNGTGGGGDSIEHYMKAHYAFTYPYLFFDHWGKPLFTILASPFALFGFKGMKLFNVLVSVLAAFFTAKLAKEKGMQMFLLIPVFYFGASSSVNITLSGLTEPLFALVLIVGIWLMFKNQNLFATLLMSFLPFARSEGLIILCVVGVYLLVAGKYKLIPFLFFGHIIIGILGYGVYKDIFWVFNRIPYAKLSTIYETGTWHHFISHLPFDIGPILYGLMGIGIIQMMCKLIKWIKERKWTQLQMMEVFLIYGIFSAFLVAHSLFHYLGIFGEMGLTRVFIGVMPLIALIALDGFEWINGNLQKGVYRKSFAAIIVVATLFYCFGNTPFSVDYKKINSSSDQKFIQDTLVPFVNQHYANYHLYFSDVSLAYFLDVDLYNPNAKGHRISGIRPGFEINKNELIIWDKWFSVVEDGVTKQEILSRNNLQLVAGFNNQNGENDKESIMLFTKK